MAREIEAKIARVLSEVEIAINVGEDDGVQPGDDVIVWREVEVKDPDSDEVLGVVKLQALRLEVYEAHARFALARISIDMPNPLSNIFKPSRVIASSNLAVDGKEVRLAIGHPVTVRISGTLLVGRAESDEEDDTILDG